MADKDFPKGVYFNKKHDNAPDFVLGTIAIKVDSIDLEQLAKYKNNKGYTKIDIKESKDGKVYGEFNTYGLEVEKPKQENKKQDNDEISIEELPF